MGVATAFNLNSRSRSMAQQAYICQRCELREALRTVRVKHDPVSPA